jgi:DME family drug/metabolite transporter
MVSTGSRGPLLVLAAATLWGTTGTAQALGPDGINPETVSLVRMLGGSLLIGYAVARGTAVRLGALFGPPLMFAIAAMAVSQPLFFTGVDRTGVAVGTIVTIGSGPILAGLLAWVIRGELPGARWLVATLVALAGAGVLVSGGESAGIDIPGVGFALAAGLAWAVYLVAAKGLFESHPPVFVAGVVFAGAAVLLSPTAALVDISWVATGRGLVIALWLGVVSSAFSYILFSLGLRGTPVAAAATLSLSEPLTAGLLGMLVLDEPARLSTIAGIVLIGAGLALITAKERTPTPLPS